MINTKLKLNELQKEYINDNYNVDLENPSFPAPGMGTVTNLDMLISALKYDKEHNYPNYPDELDKQAAEQICNDIYSIAVYYKEHDGRNYVKGYDIDDMCKRADRLSEIILNQPIEDNIFRIDQIINFIRNNKDVTEEKINEILGIRFGEIMLKDSLLEKGYDWIYSNSRNYPVIFKEKETVIDPIDFVTRKLEYDSNKEYIGALEDFYYDYK